jgi:hypothetical protein
MDGSRDGTTRETVSNLNLLETVLDRLTASLVPLPLYCGSTPAYHTITLIFDVLDTVSQTATRMP